MHQPLRDVAQELAGVRVDLLGVEADIVGEGNQLCHELGGLLESSDAGERVGEPERAAEEGALRAAKPVVSAVAGEQRTVPEVAPDGVDRRREPTGVLSLIAEQDPQKQAGVEFLPAGVAAVAAQSLGPAARFDELADREHLAPPRRCVARRDVAGVAQAKGAVERHPAHHLGVGEVHGLASHLPDAGVGLAPDAADEVGDAGESAAGLAVEPAAGLRVDQGGLEQVAVDVQLGLRGGVVADPDRA